MKLVASISLGELREMAENMYDELVEAVVDVENGWLLAATVTSAWMRSSTFCRRVLIGPIFGTSTFIRNTMEPMSS
jgi:hypothetical protein